MKEETVKREASDSNARSRRSDGRTDNHNALLQMYNGMHPSMTGYTANDAMAMQYAYMYNAYVQQSMYAQHPSYMAAVYGNMNSGSHPSYTGSENGSHNTDKTSTKLDNGKYQNKSSSPKDNVRYEPYRRASTSAPVSPAYNAGTSHVTSPIMFQNGAASSGHVAMTSSYQSHSRSGSMDNLNANSEKPVDLSQKTQKLQFLSTLKELIEAQDKMPASVPKVSTSHGDLDNNTPDKTLSEHERKPVNTNINHCDRSLMSEHKDQRDNKRSHSQGKGVTESIRPADKVDTSKALKTTEDKRAYIAVLRELFEKGHSRTSEKILATQNEAQSNLNLNANCSFNHKQAHTRPISQQSSVNINSQLDDRVIVSLEQDKTSIETENKNLVIKKEPVSNDTAYESCNALLKNTQRSQVTRLNRVKIESKAVSSSSINESQNTSLESGANESGDEMSIEQTLVLKTEQNDDDVSYTHL